MDTKQKIMDSIEWVKKNTDFTLVSEDWGNSGSRCTCAMGCVLLKDNPQDVVIIEEERENSVKAAEVLGVTEKWVNCFIEGFDGNGYAAGSELPEAWKMGAEVAEETKPMLYSAYIESLEEAGDV